jgi:integrase
MEWPIRSRTGRLRLAPRGEPYFQVIRKGASLGYRRLKDKAGSWVARYTWPNNFYIENEGQKYHHQTLGTADDFTDANGKTVLSHAQALKQALDLHDIIHTVEAEPSSSYLVNQAADDYLKHLRKQGKSDNAFKDAEQRIACHIRKPLGDCEVGELTTRQLKKWRDSLIAGRSRATANRIWMQLRAILTLAFLDEHVASDTAWRRVRVLPQASSARQRFLTSEECKRLLAASDKRLADMLRVLLFTGVRLGEACRMRAENFNARNGSIYIPVSKSGRSRDIILTAEGVELFTRLATAKAPTDLLLPGWTKSTGRSAMQRACALANIEGDVSFITCRHTHASLSIMAGVPLTVIAQQLGHTTTAMVQKHYGHLAKDYVARVVREGVPRFE